jgi:hypothetical protein
MAASEDWGHARCRRQPASTQAQAPQAASQFDCEREVDEVEWQGGRVYLHLGTRRDQPPQR